jgi:hypothetical protein
VIRNSVCWEDIDDWFLVGVDEHGQIVASRYWIAMQEETKADTLLEAMYQSSGKCYCDEE